MKLVTALLALTVALPGCVQTMPNVQRMTAEHDPSRSCFQGQEIDPRFEALKPRLGAIARADRATIEMLASNDKATNDEKAVLSLWAKSRQECAEMGRLYRERNAPPGWQTAFDAQQNTIIQAIASLYSGNITYGQFVAERQRIASASIAQLESIDNRDTTARAARAQEAQQGANRASDALQMMLMQQQQIRQQRQPINTTCTRFFDQVNCTTR